jgi:hypothetical protein
MALLATFILLCERDGKSRANKITSAAVCADDARARRPIVSVGHGRALPAGTAKVSDVVTLSPSPPEP